MAVPRVFAILAYFGICVGVAHAGDAKKARQHFEQGTTYYDLQRYEDAAREYELAFAEKNDPALLFNIGQAYRFAGNYAKAIGSFKAFLRRLPNADNRAEVEARIAEMQRMLDDQKRNQEKPPGGIAPIEKPIENKPVVEAAPPPPAAQPSPPAPAPVVETPAARPPRALRYAGIATLAVGVAALAAGAGLYAAAVSAHDELNNPSPGYVFNEDTESRMKTFEAAGIALLAVGGVATVTGATLTALGFKKASPVRALVAPTRNGAAAALSFDF
jgi:tetratricopeptide (TPR) repeat protein